MAVKNAIIYVYCVVFYNISLYIKFEIPNSDILENQNDHFTDFVHFNYISTPIS